MSQPVKLSDALVLDARLVGEVQERSIAGQVEFWAKLGRSVEQFLDGRRLESLVKRGKTERLSDMLRMVDTAAGRKRVAEVLQKRPYPHFEPCPGRTGFLIRTEADGTRAAGRFVNREFVVEPVTATKAQNLRPAVRSARRAIAAD
ncbi:MAG: TA system antitoxin ParD family protein [Terracidiphilus sp.]